MKKLDAWLARADDGLRTLLLGRGLPGWLPGRWATAISARSICCWVS